MGHPITVEELIASLRDDSPAPVRSAEASLVARLSEVREKTAAAETPVDNYDSLSLEELMQLASKRVGVTEVVEESDTTEKKAGESDEVVEVEEAVAPDDDVAELDKTAEERAVFGAQVAAHAFMQEIELIKQANELGLCRFCKEAEVVEGQSSCTACTQEGSKSE